jgi:sulfonate transport system ATP-binding protein
MLALDRVGKTYPNGVHALGAFADIRLGNRRHHRRLRLRQVDLARAIAGLDRASSATVRLDAKAITSPHAKIGIIFQEPRLLPWLSVADNIGFGLSELPAAARAKVTRAGPRRSRRQGRCPAARTLRRTGAAGCDRPCALVPQPEMLLLDEPFSRSTPFTRRDLQDHLPISGTIPGRP